MLKACCDCIAAGAREENDVYGTHLNGNSLRVPLWSKMGSQTDMTFMLPKTSTEGDQINITGVVSDNPKWFGIGLVTGSPDDIIAQIEYHFPSSENGDVILLKTLKGGQQSVTNVTKDFYVTTTGLIKDHDAFPEFTISIVITSNSVEFKVGASESGSIDVVYNEINSARSLIVNGDVKEINRLEFLFAKT